MTWLKKLFKGKKDNMVALNIKEDLSKYSKFQWVRSERAGNITELKDVIEDEKGIVWVEFTDGSRINYSLLDEYMIKTNNEVELLDITTEKAQAPIRNNSNASVRVNTKTTDNPIHSLLKKQKPNPVSIDISIEMNIPPQDLYKVICSSFDNAEDEIVDHIVSGIDINSIKESVKDAIKKYYNGY